MVFVLFYIGSAQQYISFLFFFNDTATTEIYTLSLHDALPICLMYREDQALRGDWNLRQYRAYYWYHQKRSLRYLVRSEEHTSELQSRQYLVCRLLLEKKKKLTSILITNYLLYVP